LCCKRWTLAARWHNQTYFKASTPRLPSLVIQKPSDEEASHDFLWRYYQRTPQRGMIIFNRSHYEDADCARKAIGFRESLAPALSTINQFEQMLTLSNIKVIKFFSTRRTKRRLESRLQDPDKR